MRRISRLYYITCVDLTSGKGDSTDRQLFIGPIPCATPVHTVVFNDVSADDMFM